MKKHVREKVYNKFNGRCAYCGHEIEYKDMQVDHVMCKANFEMYIKNNYKIPDFLTHLKIDQVNHIDNLFPSCRYCNKRKDTFSLETFRSELQEQLNRTNKYCATYRMAKRYGQVQETPEPIMFYFEKVNNLKQNQ